VIIGAAGAEYPVRGFIAGFDAETGRFAWRFYTVPGDPSRPFENEAMRKAAATWDADALKKYNGVGGSVWDSIAYDPDTNLIYFGTGNAGPWPEDLRGGPGKDNLYAASVLALNATTGEYKWHFQMVPGDEWDYDSVQQLILADMTIRGQQRKVLMQANKDGFYYVIDRVSGKFISGQPYAQVNWAKGLNEETGRPIINKEAYYSEKEAVTVMPGAGGAHNWSPMSFNPIAGLTYIPTSTNNSFTYAAEPVFNPQPGRMTGTVRPMPAATREPPPAIGPEPIEGSGGRGALVAWDPVAQQMRWRTPGGGGIGGGTMTTAGNLVFQTINDGRLMAYSADKGEKLLELQTGLRSGMGPPITYQLDGQQYVSLMGGVGAASAGNAGPGNSATPFSPKLLVFVLGGRAPLPGINQP
jgi:PQQ-dependent dehydrogenase (methanol/ethanol family)